MPTLAESLLKASTRPQTGLVDAFQQGQQRGRQANLMGSLASGAPREQVLQDLSYVDPMLAGREMGVFTSGQARETDAQRQQKRLAQAGPLRMEAVALANKIRQSLTNPDYDPQEDFGKYKLLESEYFTASNGKKLDVDLFTLTEEARKQGKFGMDQGKFGQDKQKIADQDIDKWRSNNVAIANLQKLDNIASFAEEAKRGNPVAIKNLIAATSRLGSNEALSDSELQLMLSGNIGDKFDAVVNRFIGTGTVFSAKDVNSAIKTLNSFAKKNIEKYTELAEEKAKSINRQKKSSYTIKDIQDRLLEGLPTSFGVKVGANFSNVERDTGDTSGAPNTATPPSDGADFDSIADMLKGR